MKSKSTAIVFFLASLINIPFAFYRFATGDEGYYLYASRIVFEGKLPYIDFFYPQAPLLPYIYGGFMKIFGNSWYSARLLAALFASFIAAWTFNQIRNTTGDEPPAWIGALLVVISNQSLVWFCTAKTYSISVALICGALSLAASNSLLRVALSGLVFGIAVNSRLTCLPAVLPIAYLVLSNAKVGARTKSLLAFGAGILIASLPAIILLALDPESFWFNNIIYHKLRNPKASLVANYKNKLLMLRLIYGFKTSREMFNYPYAILLWYWSFGFLYELIKLKRIRLMSQLILVLLLTNLMPTPGYIQYFSVLLPFLVIYFLETSWKLTTTRCLPYPARIIPHTVCLSTVIIFVYTSAQDAWRYTVTGTNIQAVKGQSRANEWKLSTIERIGEKAQQLAENNKDPIISSWSGYLVNTKLNNYPGIENHFALKIAKKLSRSDQVRFKVMSPATLHRVVQKQKSNLVILGAAVDKKLLISTLKKRYQMRLKTGHIYMFTHQAMGDKNR